MSAKGPWEIPQMAKGLWAFAQPERLAWKSGSSQEVCQRELQHTSMELIDASQFSGKKMFS